MMNTGLECYFSFQRGAPFLYIRRDPCHSRDITFRETGDFRKNGTRISSSAKPVEKGAGPCRHYRQSPSEEGQVTVPRAMGSRGGSLRAPRRLRRFRRGDAVPSREVTDEDSAGHETLYDDGSSSYASNEFDASSSDGSCDESHDAPRDEGVGRYAP
jgi:hypothetical protein